MNRRDHYADQDKARETIRVQKGRWRKRSGAGRFGSRQWSSDEDRAVLAQATSDRELSAAIRRSIGAIQHRRVRLRSESVPVGHLGSARPL